ncbi:MAG: type I-E CRISPR-associated protein Cse1/CasA [bacterium]|nr:type I-E CRISPR-associated protein Cse1/CasA [bacterium]
MHSFNLVDQPWVPVRTLDGGLVTLSLRDTLLQAHRLRCLEDASPLVLAALHRFLLAVLHRALEGPSTTEQAARWFQKGFPEDRITAYLDRRRERLDLFHPTHPFFQVPGLDQVAKPQPWTILLPEEGSNNTTLLFNPSRREGYSPNPARPDEAARALLTYQVFALQGLVKVFLTSAPASHVAPAALVFVLGENLHETLCLNLVPYTDPARDVPIWERADVLTVDHMRQCPREPARGHVQGYTWPHRSVLFLPEELGGRTAVPKVLRGAGVRLEEGEAYRYDPMVAYRYDDRIGLSSLRFRPGRGFWRDFAALLPRKAQEGGVEPGVVRHARDLFRALRQRQRPPKTMVVGVFNDQAKIEFWRAEYFELPPAILSDRDVYELVKTALNEAEESGRQLNRASLALAEGLLSRGGRNPIPADKHNLVRSLPGLAYYWSDLEAHFSDFLSGLTPESDEEGAKTRWREALYRTLRRAWQHTTQAVGNDARALRAVARADRVLQPHLAELRKKVQPA